MSRKRLSDLLREEVKKTPQNPENEAETVNLAENTATVSESPGETPIKSRAKRNSTPVNPLEATVTELTAALETANQQASGLHNQVSSLESALKEQKNLVKILETKLQQANQIATELDEQKMLVQQLSTQLKQTKALEAELEEQKQLVHKLYAQLQQTEKQASQPSSAPTKSSQIVPQKRDSSKLYERPLGRYVFPTTTSNNLSNDDIGWFD